MRGRKRKVAALAAGLALALLAPRTDALPGVGAIISAIVDGSEMATLVAEAKKRHTQLTKTIETVEKYQQRAAGEIAVVGRIQQQLGAAWRRLYGDPTELVQATLALPADVRAHAGGLVDALSGAAGADTPAQEWRAYAGRPADPAALASRLGLAPDSRAAGALREGLAATQRAEALGIAARAAAAIASRAAARARQAGDEQKRTQTLERASETALLQKMIAAQLTANDLLQALVQAEAAAAAVQTLPAEEEARRRNGALAAQAAGQQAWQAERNRQAALAGPNDVADGIAGLYSLAWARTTP